MPGPIIHGQYKTKLYGVWAEMKSRCQNSNHIQWKRYGGRGIRVCEAWQDFVAFRDWALEAGYEAGLYLDRRDNNLGYSSSNCRWVTPKVSGFNRRTTRITAQISDRIKQMRTAGYFIKEIAAEVGLGKTTVLNCLNGRCSRTGKGRSYLEIPVEK